MSLFGTSPDESSPIAEPASRSRGSLFLDEASPAPGSKSSLFADDDGPGTSPWDMPTPKKASRGELIKGLLSGVNVPESYIDFFDATIKGEGGSGGKISISGISTVLSAGSLGADDQTRIMSLIAPGGAATELGRNEFNVLLALIGLAQEGEDVTLDSVDERRRKLPVPKLPSLSGPQAIMPSTAELASKPAQRPVSPATSQPVSPAKTRNAHKEIVDEVDPWGSPALHKNHAHEVSQTNGSNLRQESNGVHAPVRTTSAFTTNSMEDSISSPPLDSQAAASTGGLWDSYDGGANSSYNSIGGNTIGADGFGPPVDETRSAPNTANRALGGGRTTNSGIEELILVTLLPEKEGLFMFQHHNYQVASSRRGSKVVRRYSDFVWLLDCLQKRYPFRQLPLLPPKRVGVNGSHLAADNTFIEKRRRGLARFANALVRHPVLNAEQLVVMFLTVPTELAVWRKQATISVQEEFVGKSLPAGLEDSLSPALNDLFEQTRSGVRKSTDIYINLCNLMDRLCKRNEGLAADQLRLTLSLQNLAEASADTYATDTNDVPLLNEGLQATAKHLSNSQSLLEDEARGWGEGVLEDLKRQRDALVSVRDMFDRKDRLDKDNIPYLEKRILASESKLAALRAKPEGLVKPGETEKVTDSIIKDKESIVAQHARGVFIRECVRDELIFFQQSQYHVSRWCQDWAQERVKYSELQADNWKQLHDQLESMPVGE